MIPEAELEARGLYDPRAPNAADRLALLRFLEAEGATLDEMVEANRVGRLLSLAGDRILEGKGARYTRDEAAALAGVTPEFFERIRQSTGLPPVDPSARIFSDSDIPAFTAFRAGAELFGEEATLELSRVIGSSVARIAEAAVALFLMNVEQPLEVSGGGELAMARANRSAIGLLAVLPPTMAILLRQHMQEAIRRQRLARTSDRAAGTVHMTVGFVDLVGFTSRTRELSPQELGRLVRDFEGRAHDLVATHGGRVVKLIGDEVMFVALEASAGCKIALSLVDAFRDESSGVTPRGGLAEGSLLMRGGDYYGTTVNLASRVADLAVPFEILVTREVAEHARGFRFEPAGRRMLKGFPEPVPLYSAAR